MQATNEEQEDVEKSGRKGIRKGGKKERLPQELTMCVLSFPDIMQSPFIPN